MTLATAAQASERRTCLPRVQCVLELCATCLPLNHTLNHLFLLKEILPEFYPTLLLASSLSGHFYIVIMFFFSLALIVIELLRRILHIPLIDVFINSLLKI